MASYERSVAIQAPAGTVTGLLHDLAGWASWTSTIVEATPLGSGLVRPGARVRVRQPGLPVSVWTVDVVNEATFAWNNYRHGLRTVATHTLTPYEGGCTLVVSIRQDGILAKPAAAVYGRVIRHHLRQLAEDITRAAESAAGTEPLDLDLRGSDPQTDQQLGRRLSENR